MKHSSRNSLLKFQPHQSIGEKFYSKRKENEILENAEQIFQETFSNEFFNLMENVLNSDSGIHSDCDAIGIDFQQNKNVVSIEAGFGSVLGTPVTVRFIWRGVTVGLGGFP